MAGIEKPRPARGAERRRVAWARFRNRVRASLPGKLTNFLPFFLQLPLLIAVPIAAIVLIGGELLDIHQREGFAQAQLARLDAAVDRDRRANASAYCRGIFGVGPYYAPCAAGERHSLMQFTRAWEAGKRLSTIRDHMLRCFETAQKEQGTSWHLAALCSGADQPSPADTFSEG